MNTQRLLCIAASLVLASFCTTAANATPIICTADENPYQVMPVPSSLYPIVTSLYSEEPTILPGGYSTVVYRCGNGVVYVCPIGNGFTCDRPSTKRYNAAVVQYCKENPNGEVSMAIQGHGTIYSWKCVGRRAVIDERHTEQIDRLGFRAGAWTPLLGVH